MNVVNMGVRLEGECQADDVSDGQEGRHGVHQRPGESDHRGGGSGVEMFHFRLPALLMLLLAPLLRLIFASLCTLFDSFMNSKYMHI